ncbi:MAG: MFS transporter [bacterium]|nr:MFS transporter [bacterium]
MFFLIGGLLFLGSGATQPYIVPYLKDLGYPSTIASLVIAMIYISQVPSRFFIYKLEELLGQIPVVFIGIGGYAIYAFIFALGNNLLSFFLATGILGFSSALFWTSGVVLLLNNTSTERYGRAVGALYAGVGFGTAIGVLWLNKVLSSFGGKIMFSLAGIPPIIALLLLFKLRPKNIVVSKAITFNSLKEIAIRETFMVSILLFISSFSYGIVYSGFSILISREIGLAWIGVLSISFYLLKSLFSRVGGGISDLLGRRFSFIISFIFGALASLMLGLAKSPIAFILSGALLGFQVSTVSVNANAWIADIAGLRDRSNYMAFIFTFNALGVAVSLLASGYLLSTSERTLTAFILFAVLNVIAVIISFFARRREDNYA